MSKAPKKGKTTSKTAADVTKPERIRKEDLKRLRIDGDADIKAGNITPVIRCTASKC